MKPTQNARHQTCHPVRYQPMLVVLIVAMLLASASEIARAQANALGSLTKGQPVVANGTDSMGQTASSTPIFVDATQFTSVTSDACDQISQAITAANGGVVDARGFSPKDQKCAFNMFGANNPKGKLLLGNVVLHVSVTQVQPSQFQVEGTGWSFSSPTNTVNQA
jgi:hypothetical protein